ncbi:site-specific integrase, partial [Synechocystis salina LEGE 06155]|nr:site-specific integrase [Synechocystis salina LEGE 06155]
EACSLAWSDVTADAMTFRIEKTKTKSSRTVAISPALQALFDQYRQGQQSVRFPSSYVFRGKRVGSHLHPSMAHKLLKAATDLIGIRGVSTHSFR